MLRKFGGLLIVGVVLLACVPMLLYIRSDGDGLPVKDKSQFFANWAEMWISLGIAVYLLLFWTRVVGKPRGHDARLDASLDKYKYFAVVAGVGIIVFAIVRFLVSLPQA